jgi:lipopolysaccharide/colanic/teichoic acid biosynthesis glycosyltransferase
MRNNRLYQLFIKRIFDIFASLFILVVFSPILLVIGFIIRMKLGSPILFKQERPGLNEKVFNLYKFRTMLNTTNNLGELLPDSRRKTKLGDFLRSTSLDELPSLFNVLKGDLSLVGPRPLLVEYLTLYNENQRKRHLVKPGLTGLAQINGRNYLSWEAKFQYD